MGKRRNISTLQYSITPTLHYSNGKGVEGMPFVSVRMTPKTPEQVAKMAEGISRVIQEACNLKPEHVWIVFEEIPTEHWAIGGHLLGKPQEKKE